MPLESKARPREDDKQLENEAVTVSVYFSIKDFKMEKVESLKSEIIQSIRDIIARDGPPKDITVTFVWY